MITNPIDNGVSTTAPPAPAQPSKGVDGLANEQTFLKLFIAQLRNQDPLQPQDGVQFISQLAQFSGLEQSLQIRQDLDSILKLTQDKAANSVPPAVQKT